MGPTSVNFQNGVGRSHADLCSISKLPHLGRGLGQHGGGMRNEPWKVLRGVVPYLTGLNGSWNQRGDQGQNAGQLLRLDRGKSSQ